jgi:hypothetical protein
MLNKNLVLIGIALSILCLVVASLHYPGGSPKDIRSVGFQWTENYISDMLEIKAVNGADNPARPSAVAGVVLMGLSTGFAFVRFARKVGVKKYAAVIQYGGLLLILLAALGTIPSLHDLSVSLSILVGVVHDHEFAPGGREVGQGLPHGGEAPGSVGSGGQHGVAEYGERLFDAAGEHARRHAGGAGEPGDVLVSGGVVGAVFLGEGGFADAALAADEDEVAALQAGVDVGEVFGASGEGGGGRRRWVGEETGGGRLWSRF